MAETAEIRSNRLIEVIKQKVDIDAFDWESLSYNCDNNYDTPDATEITTTFIPNILTLDLILPFLQSKLDRKELRINADEVLLIKDGVELAYGSLTDLTLSHDKETDAFFMTPNLPEGITFKVTAELLSDFGFMISEHLIKEEEIERDDPQVIDIILDIIFSCKLAKGKRYGKFKSDVCFPRSNGKYLQNEIVLNENKRFHLNVHGESQCCLYSSDYFSDLSPWEVLASGQFRLMR
jgi:hypothetical protein